MSLKISRFSHEYLLHNILRLTLLSILGAVNLINFENQAVAFPIADPKVFYSVPPSYDLLSSYIRLSLGVLVE